MSRNSRYKAITQRDLDIWKLEEARHEFWMGHYTKASAIIFPLCDRVIQEPRRGTQEYKDGERKPEAPVNEPKEEEQTSPWEEWNIPDFLQDLDSRIKEREERDDDGYLVR